MTGSKSASPRQLRYTPADFEPKRSSLPTKLAVSAIAVVLVGAAVSSWVIFSVGPGETQSPPRAMYSGRVVVGAAPKPRAYANHEVSAFLRSSDVQASSSPAPSRAVDVTRGMLPASVGPQQVEVKAAPQDMTAPADPELLQVGRGPAKIGAPPDADCHSVGTPVDRMLCGDSDAELAAVDRRLNLAYERALASGVPPTVLAAQRAKWSSAREEATRQSPRALVGAYEQQIYDVNAIAN